MKEEFEDSKGVPVIIRSRKSKDRQHNCIYTGTDVCRTRGRVHIPVADPIIFLRVSSLVCINFKGVGGSTSRCLLAFCIRPTH